MAKWPWQAFKQKKTANLLDWRLAKERALVLPFRPEKKNEERRSLDRRKQKEVKEGKMRTTQGTSCTRREMWEENMITI